ncbi:mutator type transposase [Tanacetum coccineum]
MVVCEWRIRTYEEDVDEEHAYRDYPNYFSLKIHHGGKFSDSPIRKYKDDTFNFFDQVDVDLFSIVDLNDMLEILGYKKRSGIYYHYKIPDSNLDFGLKELRNDQDVLNLISQTTNHKLIEIYCEHENTDLEVVFEESTPMTSNIETSNIGTVNKRAAKKSSRLPLLLMGDESEANTNTLMLDNLGNDDSIKEKYVEMENDEDSDIDKDVSSDMEVSSDSEDSDWVDEEHILNEVEVDMKDFYEYTDKDVEWTGCNKGNTEIPIEDFVPESVDLDDFHSASESDTELEGRRKKALRKLRKEHEKGGIYAHAVAIRRQLYIWKNDKDRLTAVCRGKCPVFNYPEDGPSVNGPSDSRGNLKNIGGKWVKVSSPQNKQVGSTNTGKPSGSALNKKGVKTIKVGGTKGHYIYEDITCPCKVHISKVKEIEETIKPNPEVPIRALKDQLQKKYQLGVSDSKIYRAKAKASMKVLGDFTEQYALLRDYVLELQRTNPDTTFKLDVERSFNPSEPTRQFRRIYICLGALKKGFKAGMRDLLGLDGCFMKGQYPGQLVTAVGVDANHGTYPLAYVVVEAETLNSWSWFLTCLGDDLDLTRESNFTFISDRQKGLIPVLAQVFPCAEHRFCLRHIHENMKGQFRGDLYKELLWNCACATSMPYFEKHMDKLRKTDEKAYEWLNKIPPQHWSRAHFNGRTHCDMLLNNICEVFNRRLVDGRDAPIITCLEFVREYLMKRIVKVQQMIDKAKGPLTHAAASLFQGITDEASFYKCVVDVKEKTCSCRKWELTGMPCKHVVAALWDRGTPESWVHACYWLVTWKKVYSYKINPLNGKDLWKKHPCPNTLIPPKVHPQIGRPPKKRKKSADELSSQKMTKGGKLSRAGKTVTCDTCKTPGHNKRSCKRGVGGSQPSQRPVATPTPSQASAARGPHRKAATQTPSQASAATPRASQRSRAPNKSAAFEYF